MLQASGQVLAKAHGLTVRIGVGENFKFLKATLLPAAELGERVPLLRQAGLLDLLACEAELCSIAVRTYSSMDFKSLGQARLDEWSSFIEEVRPYARQANAVFATELHSELREVVIQYQEAKTRAGLVDFEDLLLHTRDLMRHAATGTWFQRQFDHIFVDEFQDTDPIQAEILLLLSADD